MKVLLNEEPGFHLIPSVFRSKSKMIANRNGFIYVTRFDGDQVTMEIREAAHETGTTAPSNDRGR